MIILGPERYIVTMILERHPYYFFRKPAGVPSTRGDEKCFLDGLIEGYRDIPIEEIYASLPKQVGAHMSDFWGANKMQHRSDDASQIVTHVIHTFSRQQEYGLLNRLDTPTAGLLYFAHDYDVYATYRKQQKKGEVIKHYFALVQGNAGWYLDHELPVHEYITRENNTIRISYPIMHHVHLDDRMVALRSPQDHHIGRGKIHMPHTNYSVLAYDIAQNQSLLHVTITQGVRHQIRVHLAALGYPLVGEGLYASPITPFQPLCLWSVGMTLSQ